MSSVELQCEESVQFAAQWAWHGTEHTIDSPASEGPLCAAFKCNVPGVGVHFGSQLIALGLRQRRDVIPRL